MKLKHMYLIVWEDYLLVQEDFYMHHRMCAPVHADTQRRWAVNKAAVCHGWQWSREPVTALPEARWKYMRCTLKVHSEIPLSRCHFTWLIPSLSLYLFSQTHLCTQNVCDHTHQRFLEVEFLSSHRGIHRISCTSSHCTWRRSCMSEPFLLFSSLPVSPLSLPLFYLT